MPPPAPGDAASGLAVPEPAHVDELPPVEDPALEEPVMDAVEAEGATAEGSQLGVTEDFLDMDAFPAAPLVENDE